MRCSFFGRLDHILSISEPVYHNLTLDILNIVEVGQSLVSYHRLGPIHIQLYGDAKCISYTQFVVVMDL